MTHLCLFDFSMCSLIHASILHHRSYQCQHLNNSSLYVVRYWYYTVCGFYKAIDLLKLNSDEVSVEVSGIFVIIHLLFPHLAAGFTDWRAESVRGLHT